MEEHFLQLKMKNCENFWKPVKKNVYIPMRSHDSEISLDFCILILTFYPRIWLLKCHNFLNLMIDPFNSYF